MQLDVHATSKQTSRGESFVWLSASGLGVALLMVLFLVGLVLVEGVSVFWPRPVALIELRDGSGEIAGIIVEKKENRKRGVEEWRIMTGNKEEYGSMFAYIDRKDILSTSYPGNLALAERVEFGPAVFIPIGITTPEGRDIPGDRSDFWAVLNDSVGAMRERFLAVQELERHQIGSLNQRIKDLRQKEARVKKRQEDGNPGASVRLESLQLEREILTAQFEALAAEARNLRQQLQLGELRYRLPTGEERARPLGDFLRITRPNTMGWHQRCAGFIRRGWHFVSSAPRQANTEGGIFPAIFGTFTMTVLMSAAVMPLGVVAALYLREYARQGPLVNLVRIGVNNLAGVPSIVYGVFGLGFFIYFVGGGIDQLFFGERLPTATFGTGGILWASLTLALLTVPVVIVATEEALSTVPRGIREASLACGASRWQTIQRVVLPSAAPGVLTGLILAMARGAGEVAPLMLVGVVKLAPELPLDDSFPFLHLERKFMHLGFHIYDLGFQSPDSEAARPMVFATTLLLILLVVVLNLGAVILRNRLRARFHSGTF